MPIKKSAVKKVRQDKKRQLFNKARKNTFRSEIKEIKKNIETKKLDKAKETAVLAISALDKAAKKNTIHKNTAARKKSRLMKLLNKSVGKGVDLKSRKKEAQKTSNSKIKSKAKSTAKTKKARTAKKN